MQQAHAHKVEGKIETTSILINKEKLGQCDEIGHMK